MAFNKELEPDVRTQIVYFLQKPAGISKLAID